MIDLGTEDPEVAGILSRGLAIIDGVVSSLHDEVLAIQEPPMRSELLRLVTDLPRGPLDVSGAIAVALAHARGSLEHISYLVQNPVPTSPIVLQALLRAALVGSARTLYILLPQDPQIRLERGRAILAKDCESGRQGLEKFAAFEGLKVFAAPDELAEAVLQRSHAHGRRQARLGVYARQSAGCWSDSRSRTSADGANQGNGTTTSSTASACNRSSPIRTVHDSSTGSGIDSTPVGGIWSRPRCIHPTASTARITTMPNRHRVDTCSRPTRGRDGHGRFLVHPEPSPSHSVRFAAELEGHGFRIVEQSQPSGGDVVSELA